MKREDIDNHPSTFLVGHYNAEDKHMESSYFEVEGEAVKLYEKIKDKYDYVYLYRMSKCSEISKKEG